MESRAVQKQGELLDVRELSGGTGLKVLPGSSPLILEALLPEDLNVQPRA
jgi:hypothetical protein